MAEDLPPEILKAVEEYYNRPEIVEVVESLAKPKSIEDLGLPEEYIENLVLKVIADRGPVEGREIYEVTRIPIPILEEIVDELQDRKLVGHTGGGPMFQNTTFDVTPKGRELAANIMSEDPYIGVCPVPYDMYQEVVGDQVEGRYPIEIPEEVYEYAFHDVIGAEEAKRTYYLAATSGRGLVVFGPPGTGKTFTLSRMAKLLPPIVIPKAVYVAGSVLQLYDPDFHEPRPRREQPGDERWVKIHAPFVFTGAELTLDDLQGRYDAEKGVYEVPPHVKAHGGVFLVDDVGRQRDSHIAILNRLIVPMENKKDIVHVGGTAVEVFCDFIAAFSTNLPITVFDEAHLRRAPLFVHLSHPPLEEAVNLFRKRLDEMGEEYTEDALETYRRAFTPEEEGGWGLKPTFAYARDIAQLAQAIRIQEGKDVIDGEIVEKALRKHIVLTLQRKGADLDKFGTEETEVPVTTIVVKGVTEEDVNEIEKIPGVRTVSPMGTDVYVDLEGTTPTRFISLLREWGIEFTDVEVVGTFRASVLAEATTMEELMEGAEEEETTEGVGVEPETGKEERETEIIEEETEDIEDVDDLLKDLEL
ncbi:ATP-binding protein [Methanopyrus kandleri]|uniref:Predicted AAA+ class ATPase with chaperone activity n=1 Tax=Methanopyrus kandleri (strain AV19 / DSM 6324 / JCM 9639 / NBRC 100938) TaxID=190192 RepID=Q8TXG6_METKA|nr:ATP-binding protein [Methanopyrus kandleri]AAM01922.1 Predicted AAA+ class ATPase with chaperone activity [Methanopyrus kandleri AV19]